MESQYWGKGSGALQNSCVYRTAEQFVSWYHRDNYLTILPWAMLGEPGGKYWKYKVASEEIGSLGT